MKKEQNWAPILYTKFKSKWIGDTNIGHRRIILEESIGIILYNIECGDDFLKIMWSSSKKQKYVNYID